MRVDAIHHRNDPILLGSPPMKPPRFHFGLPFRAAGIWSNLEMAGVTDVVGVWQHVAQLMTVVALKQRYAGHAKRAGLIAAANSYMGRLVVVVDEDVDPSDINDVMWAITTRCEPAEQIDIVRDAWSSALDPRIPEEDKRRGVTSHSKAVIEAVQAVPVDRQVSADLGADAGGGAGDRGEMGRGVEGLMDCSPHEARSAFTRVFDALWRNAGPPAPDFASLHAGYEPSTVTVAPVVPPTDTSGQVLSAASKSISARSVTCAPGGFGRMWECSSSPSGWMIMCWKMLNGLGTSSSAMP